MTIESLCLFRHIPGIISELPNEGYGCDYIERLIEEIRQEDVFLRTYTADEVKLEFELRYNLTVEEFFHQVQTGDWINNFIEDYKDSLINEIDEDPDRLFHRLLRHRYTAFYGLRDNLMTRKQFPGLFKRRTGLSIIQYRHKAYRNRYPGITSLDSIFERFRLALKGHVWNMAQLQAMEAEYYTLARRMGFKDHDRRALKLTGFRKEFASLYGLSPAEYFNKVSPTALANREREEAEFKKERQKKREEVEKEKDRLMHLSWLVKQRRWKWKRLLRAIQGYRRLVSASFALHLHEIESRTRFPGLVSVTAPRSTPFKFVCTKVIVVPNDLRVPYRECENIPFKFIKVPLS